MSSMNAGKMYFLAEFSFDSEATDFSNESTTLAMKLSLDAASYINVSFNFRDPSTNHFAPMLRRAERSLFAHAHVKMFSFFIVRDILLRSMS